MDQGLIPLPLVLPNPSQPGCTVFKVLNTVSLKIMRAGVGYTWVRIVSGSRSIRVETGCFGLLAV